ncbi:cytochrome P450 71D11 [Arachis duranensis]|uniref:Cytochrome P450 71D11 n=1 Tax=Arachis duranensis TaxID=130453 RepID=A0A6P4C7L5_ARADU|nr:cytochrome P450 71D11 [Arachis duranensis]
MHLQLGEISAIVVSSPEYAKLVMKTHDVIFASRPKFLFSEIVTYNCTDIAFSPYGNYWKLLRKVSTLELFSPKRVNSFKSIREEEFNSLVKRIMIESKTQSMINLTEEVISTTYAIVSRAAFGSRCKDQEEFITVAKEVAMIGAGFDIGELFPSSKWIQLVSGLRPKLQRLRTKSDRILRNIINDHKDVEEVQGGDDHDSNEDLVDVLLKFVDDANGINQDICFTEDNIKAIILTIFTAGGETTATTIDWVMSEMMKNPRIMQKTQAEVRDIFNKSGRVDETCIHELKYLNSVVKETLRLHPPLPLLLPRECGKQECEINGYHIPYKSKVIVNVWAIGRDPNYWTEPEKFYPERFMENNSSIDYKGNNFEYLPFGGGRRICPASMFGIMNVELTLAFLLYHFDWKLPNEMKFDDVDMTEQVGITAKRKQDLNLIPIASCPLASL